MIVARRIVAANLVLQRHNHVFPIRNRQCFHQPGA
jgi:hypothetical protein